MLEIFFGCQVIVCNEFTLEIKLWIKKCTSNSLVSLGMRSELQAPRNGDPTVAYSKRRSSTSVAFCLGYLNKGQWDNAVSSTLSCSRCNLLLCFTPAEMSIEGTTLLSRYWHFQECDFRAEKAFTKCLSVTFRTHLQSLAEMYICARELLRMKPSLFPCNIFYFSAINLSLKHFESTTYYT